MNDERMYKVLLGPRLSEKTTMGAETRRKFCFDVAPDAKKPEVKRAVEKLFEVEVTGVRVANAKGKRKRFGMVQGRRPNRKKAYVTLKEGQDLDFMGPQ